MCNKKTPVPCADYSDLNKTRNLNTRTFLGPQRMYSLIGYYPVSVSMDEE